VRALATEVSALLLEETHALYDAYPWLTGHSRPLYSEFDSVATSVETYQLSELLTYSEKTLSALKGHILSLADGGRSLARMIMENTVRLYGYQSLDSAESASERG
jgi:hypothetical protein